MADKEKRISINKWETCLEENITSFPLRGDGDTQVVVKKTLSLQETMQFVSDVVSSCVDAKTGTYMPEIKDFALRVAVLTYYANFKMPASVEKQHQLVYCTDAFYRVKEVIDHRCYMTIIYAIDAKISHILKTMESVAAAKSNELISKLGAITDQFEAMFGGVTEDDIGKAFKALGNVGELNEESLVRAVFEAKEQSEPDATEETPEVIVFPKDKQ